MLSTRKSLYAQLEQTRKTKVITYVTGDRPGLETQISGDALDHFVHHLDLLGPIPRITLYLYTRGGSTLVSWSIANLLRQFCDELEVIVPSKAQSGGTLICLAADKIVMTKQATLGPIDPSSNGPLNPLVPGAGPNARVPVSVEAINGYIEFAKSALGEKNEAGMTAALNQLSAHVHPLVLGNAYRSRAQIRMLAKRLVSRQIKDEKKIEDVLQFLCSESGSHDYTIFRREARDTLGLAVERPDDAGYKLIKAIYDDIAAELELSSPFDVATTVGKNDSVDYTFRRSLVESTGGGSHIFVTAGTMKKQVQPAPGGARYEDERSFEGWRHEL